MSLLGLKGALLAQMTNLGLPVPPGFTLTTDLFAYFDAHERSYPPEFRAQVEASLAHVGSLRSGEFGSDLRPLLISVRLSTRISMPGLMDGLLNIGLNDASIPALARMLGNERCAWDCYRRLIETYSSAVLGVEYFKFEEAIEQFKDTNAISYDSELTADDLRRIVTIYKLIIKNTINKEFPQNPTDQLFTAIMSALNSWKSDRAIIYRQLHNIPDKWGVAVHIQAMVFGNIDNNSASIRAMTRDPLTGARDLYGEFLINAQQIEVSEGNISPQPIMEAARILEKAYNSSLETAMPAVFLELKSYAEKLESYYRDMQDMECTVERGKLWVLGTRACARTARASVKIAVEMAAEGRITREEAVRRVSPSAFEKVLEPTINQDFCQEIIAKGLPASTGVASGRIAFSSSDVYALAAQGEPAILVMVEMRPEDVAGMETARGAVTTRGGMTSHAAVRARGMGRPCVTAAGRIRINFKDKTLTAIGRIFRQGDFITVDGHNGNVLEGIAPTVEPDNSGDIGALIRLADDIVGGVIAIVSNIDDAVRSYAWGRRSIVASPVGFLSNHPDGIRLLCAGVYSANKAISSTALDEIYTLIRDAIICIVESTKAEEVCVIVGEIASCEESNPLSELLDSRGGYVIKPDLVSAQYRAIQDAVDQLANLGYAPNITLAVANVFHESDFELIERLSLDTSKRVSIPQKAKFKIAGILDSPHSIIFRKRIFRNADLLIIDIPSLARNLFLLPSDAIEIYQDLGYLDLGFETGGAFNDVLDFLDRFFRNGDGGLEAVPIHALLNGPSHSAAMKVLGKCGVTRVALPAALLPTAIIKTAHSVVRS